MSLPEEDLQAIRAVIREEFGILRAEVKIYLDQLTDQVEGLARQAGKRRLEEKLLLAIEQGNYEDVTPEFWEQIREEVRERRTLRRL